MTDPMDAIRAQEEALAAATWTPLEQVPGLETAPVMGMTAVRKVGTTAPVLWFSPQEWQRFVDGDPDILVTLQHLAEQ